MASTGPPAANIAFLGFVTPTPMSSMPMTSADFRYCSISGTRSTQTLGVGVDAGVCEMSGAFARKITRTENADASVNGLGRVMATSPAKSDFNWTPMIIRGSAVVCSLCARVPLHLLELQLGLDLLHNFFLECD